MYKTTLVFLFIIVAVLIFTQILFKRDPVVIGRYLITQIASGIGITVSVPQNPFNTLAQELQKKEASLLEKEEELRQRESELREKAVEEEFRRNRAFLIYLLAAGGVLLGLILLNFYFDHRRFWK